MECLFGGSFIFDDGGFVVRDVDEFVVRRVLFGRVYVVDDVFYIEFMDDVIEFNVFSFVGCDFFGVVFGYG